MHDDHHPPFSQEGSDKEELLNELDSLKELLDEEHESPHSYSSIDEIGSVKDYLRLKQQATDANLSIEEYLAQQSIEHPVSEEPELIDESDNGIPILDEIYTVETESETENDSLLLDIIEEEEEPLASAAEATSVEEYFAAVAAAKHHPQAEQAEPPVLDEVIEVPLADELIPVLDEVVTSDETIPLLDEVVATDDAIPVLDEVATQSAVEPEVGLTLDDMHELVGLIVNRKLQQLKPELEREVMAELQKLLPISALTKF